MLKLGQSSFLQQIVVHVRTVLPKPPRTVLRTVVKSVSRATLDSLSMERSALVRRPHSNTLIKLRMLADFGLVVITQSSSLFPLTMSLLCVVANSCKCDNGLAPSGADCPVNGAQKCVSCNPGYTLDLAKSTCIRACAQTLSHSVYAA